ncbi:hypothetical protein EFV37_32275 [Mesorhizobium loti]|uniref:Uncharacterized protein n=2 Tax=Mesorhizobium TaxID=68287 RepID=M5B2M8_RHILI|nr:hypothetical protein A9174_31605 [Mesorhizobium loti NZP2037]OBP72223.1 hypothetical protein BAE42_15450 [Mesorhizobium loti]QKC66382.1 hypothetical protein EB229_32265 [Mesorhizobium jarvisii]QKC79168.1 hypothetical protein EB233_29895 [Mesorhizobium erdmanii]OBP78367.1 hypothetical protein BAE39_30145 [Mesorhizobium loti]
MIQVLQIEERRLVTESAAVLKRRLEAETEVDRQEASQGRFVAEREEVQAKTLMPKARRCPDLRK